MCDEITFVLFFNLENEKKCVWSIFTRVISASVRSFALPKQVMPHSYSINEPRTSIHNCAQDMHVPNGAATKAHLDLFNRVRLSDKLVITWRWQPRKRAPWDQVNRFQLASWKAGGQKDILCPSKKQKRPKVTSYSSQPWHMPPIV